MSNNFGFDNFETAKNMIPMEAVKQIIEQRKCRNANRGCKFQTQIFYCKCCMMLHAIGSDFFQLKNELEKQDPDFIWSMTDWQREEYEKKSEYWEEWLRNYYPWGRVP